MMQESGGAMQKRGGKPGGGMMQMDKR
jgi:hypothetical protein